MTPRLDSLNCNRKHLGRGVDKTFTDVDIQSSTAWFVKGKERKGREVFGHRVVEVDVNGNV